MATLKKIAEEAGLSVFATSRILSGKSKEIWPAMIERAERVRKIAAKYGYMPNGNALAMRRQQTMTVGVLVRNTSRRPMHYLAAYEMIIGINLRLQSKQYVMSLIRLDDVTDDLRKSSRVFSERMLDGMIVLDSLPDEICDHLRQLMPQCVWLDTNRFSPHGCIRRDELFSGHLAASKLIEAGYRTIVSMRYGRVVPPKDYLDGVPPHFSSNDRCAGVRQAVEKAGCRLIELTLPNVNEEFGAEVFGDLFSQKGLGVVAGDSVLAQRVVNAALDLNLRPGVDYGLVSCDFTHQAQITFPALSAVNVDRFQMGDQAAEMMLAMIENPEQPVASLILRGQWHEGRTIGRRGS